MNRLSRPPTEERRKWNANKRVRKARKALREKIDGGGIPTGEKKGGDFPPLWKSCGASEAFQKAQKLVCGYCGRKIGESSPHLDHFRPKGEVYRSIETPGREKEDQVSVEGRKFSPNHALKPGYWWLAYDWNNFVVSCERCNSAWKGSLFMIKGDADAASPQKGQKETALLLNPFEVEDPLQHLAFDEHGGIAGISEEGRATVATCGLDRPSLVGARQCHLSGGCLDLMDDVVRPGTPEDERKKKVKTIWEKGNWDQPFASVIRSVAKEKGIDWSSLAANRKKDTL